MCLGPGTDAPKQADYWALKGCNAYALGDPRAEEYLLTARAAYLVEGAPWKAALRMLRVLGRIAYERGDYHKGLTYYRESLALHQAHEPWQEGAIGGDHYNIGNCFWGLDQRDSCSAHYAIALRLWAQQPDGGPPLVAYVHEVLGTYAWEAGDEALALDHFAEAARRQLKDAPDTDAADGLATKAWGSAGADRAEEAISLFEQAVEFRTNTFGDEHPNTACMHSDMAALLLRLNRPEEALARAQGAIVRLVPGFKPKDDVENPAVVDQATSIRHLYDALVVKFDVLSQRDDARSAAAADAAIDLAMQCIERLRTAALAAQSKLFWTDRVRGFVERALRHSARRWRADPGDVRAERALALMEIGRNALLSEAMAALDAANAGGLPKPLADKERAMRARIAEMERYVLLEEKKCERMDVDKVGLWRNALTSAEAGLDSLVRALARAYPNYHELKYGTARVSLTDLRERLGDRALLAMHDGEEASCFILVRSNRVQLIEAPQAPDARTAIERLRSTLVDPSARWQDPQGAYDAFVSSAHALHQRIVGGFDAPFPVRLTVVADGAYQHIPFEVLLTAAPAAGKRDYAALDYLVKSCAISYSPGVRSLLSAPGDGRSGEGYLGMHASERGRDLAAAREEVEAAHRLLGGTMLGDSDATEASFKKEAPTARIIHLAMHAAADDIDPMNSALAFAPDSVEDGLLHAHELFGMRIAARLALLSACRTGEGRMLKGEGRMSLARGFAHAGCPSLLMSLWPCNDATTGSLVTRFLGLANDEAALDEALREAKLDYLRTADPVKAHPALWSSLVLSGDERAMKPAAPWYATPWWLLVLAAPLLWRLRGRQRAQ
ncbi:MAG: CHAT domain-containing protein [Flavobacteriales bacterium]|nr:CHAT domain-containing protein [Flavobacteriales bacterium]